MPQRSIFILASERSGTNLLRSLLSNHKQIEGPIAPHFLDVFWPILNNYRDLTHGNNMERLFHDMVALANHKYHNWDLQISFDELRNKYSIENFMQLFDALYYEKAAQAGKGSYVCKGNHIFNYGHVIANGIPNAKFLYLVRDPRDHVASWKKKPLFIKTPYDAITKWAKEQQACLSLRYAHNFEVHQVRYEDLIADPVASMRKVLEFVEQEDDPNCYSTDQEKNKEIAWNKYWENLSKPIMKDNQGKYKKVLTPEEINMIEFQAGDLMNNLGYDLSTSARWQRPKFFGSRLKLKRRLTAWKFREHINQDMLQLQDKMKLIQSIRNASK